MPGPWTFILITSILVCVIALMLFRKKQDQRTQSRRALAASLLVTLIGTYLGLMGSFESSKTAADQASEEEVIAQARLATSNLSYVDAHPSPNRNRATLVKLVGRSLPSMKRLASHPDSPRVLGVRTISALDSTVYYAELYANDESSSRQDAVHSHLLDAWRTLTMTDAAIHGDDRFQQCSGPEARRRCDNEIRDYLRQLGLYPGMQTGTVSQPQN